MMALWLWACAPDLGPDPTEGGDPPAGLVQTTDGDVVHSQIDATSETDWIPYDFATASITAGGEIEVQRFRVRLAEGVEVAWVEGVAFDEVVEEPADGWTVDAEPIEADEDYAFNVWYDYDEPSHTLAPADRIAVLRSTDGPTVKISFDGYYDDVGTPGYLAFHWSPL